jgi:hypothetical protein
VKKKKWIVFVTNSVSVSVVAGTAAEKDCICNKILYQCLWLQVQQRSSQPEEVQEQQQQLRRGKEEDQEILIPGHQRRYNINPFLFIKNKRLFILSAGLYTLEKNTLKYYQWAMPPIQSGVTALC